ncbi:hypothetical protein J6590_073493 [Homalodisca vitripennis]|nr:hypothetical protein J6590_073493 [Homalodisca vitripennis]
MTELTAIEKVLNITWSVQTPSAAYRVPGHVGISENELADEGAKDALEVQPFSTRMMASIDYTDDGIRHYPVVKAKIKVKWSSEWRAVGNNKLRRIKECLCFKPLGTASRSNRREEVVFESPVFRSHTADSRLPHEQ